MIEISNSHHRRRRKFAFTQLITEGLRELCFCDRGAAAGDGQRAVDGLFSCSVPPPSERTSLTIEIAERNRIKSCLSGGQALRPS
jgi:hypothetical protein